MKGLRSLTAPLLIRVACVVGLTALALMAWSIFVPRTVPVLLSMSLGQGLGALALLCYLSAILLEMGRQEEKHPQHQAPEQAERSATDAR